MGNSLFGNKNTSKKKGEEEKQFEQIIKKTNSDDLFKFDEKSIANL